MSLVIWMIVTSFIGSLPVLVVLILFWKDTRNMHEQIKTALDGLSAAVDEQLTEFGTIEQQLRDATSLDDAESTAIAERIASITDRLRGTVSETAAAVQDAGSGDGAAAGGEGSNASGDEGEGGQEG